jgi:hypothetical protein
MRTGTNISEQPFIINLGIPSSPTDFDGRSNFIAFWTSECEIGTKYKISIVWLTEENLPEQELLYQKNERFKV